MSPVSLHDSCSDGFRFSEGSRFSHEIRRPQVTLIMAETLDGRIARHGFHPVDWTEPADKTHFAALTRRMGLVCMGSATFDTLGGPLPGRKNVVFTRFPEKRPAGSDLLLFTSESPVKVLAGLADEGYGEVGLIGGSVLNREFARCGCIDEVLVTLSPLFFGEGPRLFSGDVAMELHFVSCHPLGSDAVLLHYRVKK